MLQFGVFWLNKMLLSVGTVCVSVHILWGVVCVLLFLIMFWDWLPYARACLKIIVVSVRGVFLVVFLILSSGFFFLVLSSGFFFLVLCKPNNVTPTYLLMPVRTSIRSRRAKSRLRRGSRISRRRVRGGNPNYDGMTLRELEAMLRVVKEQQLNIKQQELNLKQQLVVVEEQLQLHKRMDLGSTRTVSSAGEGGNEKPLSRASA